MNVLAKLILACNSTTKPVCTKMSPLIKEEIYCSQDMTREPSQELTDAITCHIFLPDVHTIGGNNMVYLRAFPNFLFKKRLSLLMLIKVPNVNAW